MMDIEFTPSDLRTRSPQPSSSSRRSKGERQRGKNSPGNSKKDPVGSKRPSDNSGLDLSSNLSKVENNDTPYFVIKCRPIFE